MRLWEIPFSSIRKRQTAAYKLSDDTVRVYVKGAPEIVMNTITQQVNAYGEIEEIDEEEKAIIISDVV